MSEHGPNHSYRSKTKLCRVLQDCHNFSQRDSPVGSIAGLGNGPSEWARRSSEWSRAGYLTVAHSQPKMSDAPAWPHSFCNSLFHSLAAVCPLTSIYSPASLIPWTFILFPAPVPPPGFPHTLVSHSQLFLTFLIGLIPIQENRYLLVPCCESYNEVFSLASSNFEALHGLFPQQLYLFLTGAPLKGGEEQSSWLWFQLLLGHLLGLLALGAVAWGTHPGGGVTMGVSIPS